MSAREVGLEMLSAVSQRAHIPLHLVCHPAYHACGYRVPRVLAEERNQLALLGFHQRQFLGQTVKHRQPHLYPGSDISPAECTVGRHIIVGNRGACIDNQQVLIRAKRYRPHRRCQSVLTQRLRRVVAVANRNRRLVVEQDEMRRQAVQRIDHRRLDVYHRGDDTVRDGVERKESLHIRRRKRLVDKGMQQLTLITYYRHLRARVALVDTEIHALLLRR